MELIDSHAHLDDEQLSSQLDGVLHRAREASVVSVVTIGTTAASSRLSVDLAARSADVFAAVGIQPNHTAEALADDWSRIVQLASRGRVVAIGETGLDRFWDFSPLNVQQDYFDRHLRLAQQTMYALPPTASMLPICLRFNTEIVLGRQ